MRWPRSLDPRVAEVAQASPGERCLAWGELEGGAVAVCTDLALHLPGGRRLPWDLIVRAAWSEEFLDLVAQSEPGARSSHLRLRFEAPGEVPAVVRERIEWTVLASRPVVLEHPDGRQCRAVLNARRSPRTGEVRWSVVFDREVDADDPTWRAAADAALARARAQLGI